MAVESVSLYCNEGTSDKVYNTAIEKESGGYVVTFSYGRRGGPLKSGTKTNNPVSLDEARVIFNKLVDEKTKKGYNPL